MARTRYRQWHCPTYPLKTLKSTRKKNFLSSSLFDLCISSFSLPFYFIIKESSFQHPVGKTPFIVIPGSTLTICHDAYVFGISTMEMFVVVEIAGNQLFFRTHKYPFHGSFCIFSELGVNFIPGRTLRECRHKIDERNIRTGTRKASPSSFPFISGITSAIALAAPVV